MSAAAAMDTKEHHHLIFLPGPGTSHLTPAIKVGKLILSRNSSLSITYLLINNHHTLKHPIRSPRLQFLNLPEPETPTTLTPNTLQKLQPIHDTEHINKHMPQVKQAVYSIIKNTNNRVAGLVLDMFCVSMIDVGNELGIPSYVFYTSSAAFLSFKLFFQTLRDERGKDITQYKDSDEKFIIPGFVHPVPAKVMPSVMLDKNGGSDLVMASARQIRKARGIFINTFVEIDSTAIKSLIESTGQIPPIYPIGPVINLNSESEPIDYGIIHWLDRQPPGSVVFLCFGSQGSFPRAQIEHLACAIEKCGYRFLWSLRNPNGGTVNEILPEGFLERSSGVGKVIGWAPQAAVLSHPAVGGFVSHCGWNSVLESAWFGVPIAAWPIEAEQQLNAFHVVAELGIATEIRMDYRGDVDSGIVVESEVIANAIGRIMGEESSEMRRKIRVLREKGFGALMEGGSSDESMYKLIGDMLRTSSRSNT